MARMPAICAEPGLKTALALLNGERPSRTASAVQIHGNMLVGRGRGGLTGGRGRRGKGRELGGGGRDVGGTGSEWEAGGLGLGSVRAGSRLILFDGDGSCNIVPKRGGYMSPTYQLVTDGVAEFFGEKKYECVIRPSFGKSVCYVLKGNG